MNQGNTVFPRGSISRPSSHSDDMNFRIAAGLSNAEGWFLHADLNRREFLLKPMRNPFDSPS